MPNLIDKQVGNRVRMRRMMLGISQTALGDALNVTFQQIQKYERGTNRISASSLQQIANTLNVPVSFFFGDGLKKSKDTPGMPAYVSEFLGTYEGLALARSFVRIKSSKLQRHIAKLVAEIAEHEATSKLSSSN
jgi:transcriptional regulator with XRE-family HTH domain